MRLFILMSCLFFVAQPAHANVIYNWVNNDNENCCTGQIVITDAAYLAGSVSFVDSVDFDPRPLPEDAGGLVSFIFTPFGGAATALGPLYSGYNVLNLTVAGNGLAGSFTAFTENTSLEIHGAADFWTVESYLNDFGGTDSQGNNCARQACSGGAGRWQLVEDPAAVPEPASALLLLGALGPLIAFARRRRSVAA
jgi:hypothetical protein